MVKAYRLLYVPLALKFKNFKILNGDHIAFIRFVWLSKETVPFALYAISRLVFITEVESVYCAVRTESL
jgi:hypothetical protein